MSSLQSREFQLGLGELQRNLEFATQWATNSVFGFLT